MHTYLDDILDYYYALDIDQIDPATKEQVGKTLLDYLGCAIYTAKHANADSLVKLILDFGAPGSVEVFGTGETTNAASAAMANACRVSNIEMDDGSGINAAVHPGVYVWSAAIAQYKLTPCDSATLTKAIIFGYDLCMRAGMLAAKNVSAFQLHGPGMNGAFGAVAAAGMIAGLSRSEIQNAIGTAASMLPICPFVSFINGTDNKDLYGGWGVYLALFAVEAARRGITGPLEVLDDVKSLKTFFDDSWGKDTPMGNPYYINLIGFKEFPSCLMAHPSLTTLGHMVQEHNFTVDDIETLEAHVHPGAYTLNSGVTFPLSPVSARLYLPYCLAAFLKDGMLHPDAFTDEAVNRPDYLEVAGRIQVINEPDFSAEVNGVPLCKIVIHLKDGRVLTDGTRGIHWCVEKASKEELIEKFIMLTNNILEPAEQQELIRKCFPPEPAFLTEIAARLNHMA